MAGNVSFLWNQPARKWKELYDLYPKIIKIKADKKTKPQARKELLDLDNWYQFELPSIIKSRSEPFMTHEEITKLMKWKLARGKFRPALPALVASNRPVEVEQTTRSALALLPDLAATIKGLSTLRGIGPATASAIVAAAAPEAGPFMADECVLAATPGVTAIKYDLRSYLNYAQLMRTVTDRLKAEDTSSGWTVHKAELALWAHSVAAALSPNLLTFGGDSKNHHESGDQNSNCDVLDNTGLKTATGGKRPSGGNQKPAKKKKK